MKCTEVQRAMEGKSGPIFVLPHNMIGLNVGNHKSMSCQYEPGGKAKQMKAKYLPKSLAPAVEGWCKFMLRDMSNKNTPGS